MKRYEVLEQVVEIIAEINLPHPVRVAIDGVDGAGKTIFADELAGQIERRGRAVIRASVDSFHNPRSIRYRRGRSSPEGYFRDSFDYDAVVGQLLQPLGPTGSGLYRTGVFDYKTDLPVVAPLRRASDDAILLFDGIFLLRPELRPFWDLRILLQVNFDVSMGRCAQRDGGNADASAPENRRYVEGQKIYFAECDPAAAADIVIDNNDAAAPHFLHR
jgi:uridine kinase